jgi:hypothetical protein
MDGSAMTGKLWQCPRCGRKAGSLNPAVTVVPCNCPSLPFTGFYTHMVKVPEPIRLVVVPWTAS